MKTAIITAFLLFGLTTRVFGQRLLPVLRDGKWGFINDSGVLMVDFRFDKAVATERGVAKARSGKDLYIFFEGGGQVKLEDADLFDALDYGVFKLHRQGKWWLCDSAGTLISERGYDRISNSGLKDSLFYFSESSLSGVLSSSGEEVLPAIYKSVRINDRNYFSVMLKSRLFAFVDKRGNAVLPDSFFRVNPVDLNNKVYLGLNSHNVSVLFRGEGEVLGRGKKLEVEYLGNGFLTLRDAKKKMRLYDAEMGEWHDTLGSKFGSTDVKNAVILEKEFGQWLYIRGRGILVPENEVMVMSSVPPYLMNKGIFWGLNDEEMKTILPLQYLQVQLIKGPLYDVADTHWKHALYNIATRKFETEFKYLNLRDVDGAIKAYGHYREMDLIELDTEFRITEILHFEKVNSVNVSVKSSRVENWALPRRQGGANMGNRPTGWKLVFEPRARTNYYGLFIKGDSGKTRLAAPPVFESVNVLPRDFTVATYAGTNKEGVIGVKGMSGLIPGKSFRIFQDSTGRYLGPVLQHVRLNELRDSVAWFSIFANGQAMILDKYSYRTLFKCTYVQPLDREVYAVYLKGYVKGLLDGTFSKGSLSGADCFRDMGLYNTGRKADYMLEGGEWQLYSPEKGLLKPAIASPEQRILHVSSIGAGYAIVELSNGKQGVIDARGNTIIAANYDNIVREPEMPGHFFCGNSVHKYGLVSGSGEMLSNPMFNALECKGEVYRGSIKDSTYLYDPISMSAMYLGNKIRTSNFNEGSGFVRYKKGYQLTTNEGDRPENNYYRNALGFHNGFAPVQKLNRWGLMDAQGKMVLQPQFAGAMEFGISSAVFKKQSWKFYTPEGKKIKGPKRADAVTEIYEGVFVYRNDAGNYGIYNTEGKKISGFRFREKPFVYNDLIIGSKRSRTFFFSPDGKKLGSLEAHTATYNRQITDEMALIGRDKESQKPTITFSRAQMRAYGLDSPWRAMTVQLGLEPGAMLQNRRLLEAYTNDVYLVRKSRFYFMNGNGDKITEQGFVSAEPMRNGMSVCFAEVKKAGLLDKGGFWIIPPVYADLKKMNDSVFAYKVEYEFELKNAKGEAVFSHAIDSYVIGKGVVRTGYRNKMGYCDLTGKVIWELSE